MRKGSVSLTAALDVRVSWPRTGLLLHAAGCVFLFSVAAAEAQRGRRSIGVYRLVFAPLFLLPSVALVAQSLVTALLVNSTWTPQTEAEAKDQRLLLGETRPGSEGREETKGEVLGESLPRPDPAAALGCKSHPPPPSLSCPKARELGFPSPHWLVTGHRLPWDGAQGQLSPGTESAPGAPGGDLEHTAAGLAVGAQRDPDGVRGVLGGHQQLPLRYPASCLPAGTLYPPTSAQPFGLEAASEGSPACLKQGARPLRQKD